MHFSLILYFTCVETQKRSNLENMNIEMIADLMKLTHFNQCPTSIPPENIRKP